MNAEDVIPAERLQAERAMYRPPKRSRLTIDDFDAIGVNLVEELWKGVKQIDNPASYVQALLEIMSFVIPKINPVDIQAEVTATGPESQGPAPIDFSKVPRDQLSAALRLGR